jgi:stage II sporulation protein D
LNFTTVRSYLYIVLIIFFSAGCIPQPSEKPLSEIVTIKVLLAEIKSMDSLKFSDDYSLKSEEALYEFGRSNRKLYINPLENGLQLFNANRNLIYKSEFPVILKPANEAATFIFRGATYQGTIIFEAATPTSVYIINKLPLEYYVRGVVPFEIISTKKEYYDAIKAQAICARTYAFDRILNPRSDTFDIYGSIMDQAYGGYSRKFPLAQQAVNETEDIIILYQARPAKIYYHSTCGGMLEAAEAVWDIDEIPFLKPAKDIIGNKFACQMSPKYRWQEKRTLEQLDSSFALLYHKEPLATIPEDTLKISMRLEILNRTDSGRIANLKVSYRDTVVVLSGNAIRNFFSWPVGGYLWSNLFTMQQEGDSVVVLTGAGYGHGVGLCQYGAMQMSADGYHYYHILSKYFPGTILGKINQVKGKNETNF